MKAEGRDDIGRQIADTLAVFGGDGDRLAKAERERVKNSVGSLAPFRLVRDQNDGLARMACDPRKSTIGGGHSVARVDDEQHQIGNRDGLLGLFAHAIGNRSLPRFLETGRVDQADFGIEQICDAFAPVARQTRQVGDERRARAGQPVEQRRFADVRTADDRDDRKLG